jgi:hypothetical protein
MPETKEPTSPEDVPAREPPPPRQVKERNKLILGLGQLLVKLALPVLAAGGAGTGTYAALSRHGDKQQVSTSYEQFAERFNRTLEQLDQMRLRQMENSEDQLKLRLALHEVDDRLRALEHRSAVVAPVARPPKPPKAGVTPPPPTAMDDLLTKKAPKRAPLPAFKSQQAPVRFDLAIQKK